MAYQLYKGTFSSYNGLCDISWYFFMPKGVTVRAVVQISHGMCEYILRYTEFAEHLCAQGIAVYGCDHLGHGDSVSNDDPIYGYFGKQEKSLDILVENQKLMNTIIRKRFPHLPLIMFGHSMGSFVARKYMVQYPDSIDGVILCGTGGSNKMTGIGIALLTVLSAVLGKKRRSKWVDKLVFGGYNQRFPNEDDKAWLTKDQEIRNAYCRDTKSNFLFPVGSMLCLLHTHKEVNCPEWYAKVPKGLPILLVAGEDDPVGNYGEGVREVYNGLEDAEICMLDMKLYEDDRHEILNEIDKDVVYSDLVAYIGKVAEGVYAARTQNGYEGMFGVKSE